MSQGSDSASLDLDLMTRQGRSFSGNERNCCFLNTRGSGQPNSRFANISAVSGMDFPDDGRALAVVDWDHDGDLDMWISNRNAPRLRMLRNDSANPGRSIQLKLVGNGTDTNRDAIGARVTLETSELGADGKPVRLIKTVRAGEGFISQSSHWLHFGIAENAEVKSISVDWPNRASSKESFTDFASRGRFVLQQGTGKATLAKKIDRKLALQPSKVTVPPRQPQQRIPIIHQLPAPQLGYFDFDGKPHEFKLETNTVTLVNIWSSTCAPCLKELREFSERAKELEQAGIRVLALSVDELETNDPNSKRAAQAVVDRFKMPFTAGMAPPAIVEELRNLHNILIKMERPLPLPTSFLFDRDGRLDVIYKGTVSVETLVKDAKPKSAELLQRFAASAAFPGTVIDSKVINSTMEIDKAWAHVKMAKVLFASREVDKAIVEYELALDRVPDSENVLNNLGTLYQLKGNSRQSVKMFLSALQLNPKNAAVRVNLAQVYIGQNNMTNAKIQVDQAIIDDPKNANAHFIHGVVLSRLQDPAGAAASYVAAIKFDPRHARAQYSLGKVYERQSKFELAKKHYQLAFDVMPNEPAILTGLANIYVRENNLVEAERLVRRAVDAQPKNPDAIFLLGSIYQKQGNVNAASQQFQRVLSINPRHQGAREALQKMMPGTGGAFGPKR